MGNKKWRPTKRLTWHQIDHLRTLRRNQPAEWSKTKLAHQFGISIPAVNRILKSKFEPTDEVKERQDAKAKEQTIDKRAKSFELNLSKSVKGKELVESGPTTLTQRISEHNMKFKSKK